MPRSLGRRHKPIVRPTSLPRFDDRDRIQISRIDGAVPEHDSAQAPAEQHEYAIAFADPADEGPPGAQPEGHDGQNHHEKTAYGHNSIEHRRYHVFLFSSLADRSSTGP